MFFYYSSMYMNERDLCKATTCIDVANGHPSYLRRNKMDTPIGYSDIGGYF